MAGRRGARSGRGWDAIPPRPADDMTNERPAEGELRHDGTERGNVPARRRRGSPENGPPEDDGSSARPARRGRGGVWAGVSSIGGSGTGSAGGFGGRRSKSSARGRDAAADGSEQPAGPTADGQRSSSGGWGRSGQAPQSESERAREICLRQLAVRPRTRVELAKALAAKEISDEVIAEVLDRYDEVGIIDDAAFARAWVASRHQGRGLAKRALANELRRHGVEAEVASEALEAIDEDDEAATARALVDRKLRTATGAPDAVFRRLVGMLARKGYPAGVSIRAVKDALAARDAEAAEFADQIDADALADEVAEPPS
jgi:regulatory protein